MRVIETDNFNGDYPNEKWACPYYFNKQEAQKVANLFNELMRSTRCWKVVDDNYKLQAGFEP